jgi:Phage tail assembly chaperone proteins, E, or 41 or 14
MSQAAKREGFIEDEAEKVTTIKPATETRQIEPPNQKPPDDPPPPADAVDPYVTRWPMRIKLLHKQIRGNNNEEIKEIAFREPTGGDINRYGSPIRMNPDGMFDVVDRNMSMIMAALSGINLPFIERMDPRDWNSCAYRLKLYFQPDTTGWL